MDAGSTARSDDPDCECDGAEPNVADSAKCRLGCRNIDRREASGCSSLFR
jgi:hypothetical protein